MASMLVLLFLAAVLTPSLLQDDYENNGLEDLSTTKPSVQEEIVNKHNQLRRMVSPSGSDLLKMEWNHDAQVNAQDWADKCMSISPIELRTPNLKCGENLFMSNYLAPWSSVIQSWYDEVNDFDFGLGPKERGSKVGHYTQSSLGVPAVWNSTFQVACGLAKCLGNSLKFLYVCQYCPGCEYEDKYSNCEDLKKKLTCNNQNVKESCRATCYCEGKIH